MNCDECIYITRTHLGKYSGTDISCDKGIFEMFNTEMIAGDERYPYPKKCGEFRKF